MSAARFASGDRPFGQEAWLAEADVQAVAPNVGGHRHQSLCGSIGNAALGDHQAVQKQCQWAVWLLSRLLWSVRPVLTVLSVSSVLLISSTGSDLFAAEDRVTVRDPETGSQVTIGGVIEDDNGREITLRRTTNDKRILIPRDRVVDVQASLTATHQQALKLWSERQIEPAKVQFESALMQEERPWVRRELVAGLVRCHLWVGDLTSAAKQYLTLAAGDEHGRFAGLMPLVWDEAVPVEHSLNEARAWLAGPQPEGRLLAASWLWSVPADRARAEVVLKELAGNERRPVQRMAQAQLWRVRLANDVVPLIEYRRWEREVEQWPKEWRCGPMVLLARAREQLADDLAAASAYLWLITQDSPDRELSAWSLWQASEALRRAGDVAGQQRLLAEWNRSFPETRTHRQWSTAVDSSSPAAPPAPQ